MSEHIEITRQDGVLVVGIANPDKKNALSRAMYAAMADALRRADEDGETRAIVVKGVPDAFCAGNDIRDFAAFASGGERMVETEEFLLALVHGRKPIVGAVDGLAIGIGATMLMHFDMVFATPRSFFRTPFLDLGLVPEAASSLIAPRLMGHQRAFALLVAGETFQADAALAANLVTRIVAQDEVEDAAMTLARDLAAKPPEALRIGRELLRGDRGEIEARIRLEIDHFSERLRSTEAREKFAAFMDRSKR